MTAAAIQVACKCGKCGRSYSDADWPALAFVGYQLAENPDEILELRNCSCGSTLSVVQPGPGFWLETAVKRIADARLESHHNSPLIAQSYVDRAATCLAQATELLQLLQEQRIRSARAQAELDAQVARALAQAAE